MREKLSFNPNETPRAVTSVEGVRLFSSYATRGKPIENFGPFITKSGGELSVLFAFDVADISDLIKELFNYDEEELEKLGFDIRGFRSYEVAGLKVGVIGGLEFHRIRKEIVVVANGAIKLTLEDLKGGVREIILQRGEGVWIPPFVIHTYETVEDYTRLTVIANTLLDPTNPNTVDTFPRDNFEAIKKKLSVT